MSHPALMTSPRLLHLDVATYRVTLGSELIQLTPTEWRLLALLVQHAGTTLTYQRLIDAIYHDPRRSLDRLQKDIARVRTKLGDNAIRYVQRDRTGGGYTVPTSVLAPRPDPLAGYTVATARGRATLGCPWPQCATLDLLADEQGPATVTRLRELAAWHELEHRAAPDE